MTPLLAILLVLVALGALMAGVRMAQQRFAWDPEISRKTVHVLMGLVCLSFPWLFREAWAVWLLAGGAALTLGAVRLWPPLRARFGRVLCGVERESWGELLFPLAVAFVFWLARGDALLFCVPVLVLTLADALAALIGRRYGLARYETDDGWKSLEGSAAFFVTAFFSTHIPLLLSERTGRLESVLIAAVMGFILMLMEAVAWRGLDNLFIPLVSYVCLVRLIGRSPADLALHLGVLLAIVLGLGFWRKSTRLTQSALIGAALILYVTWAVCDWHWLIAPVMTAAGYTLVCLAPSGQPQRHNVYAIACIGGLGLCWLCLLEVTGTVNTIYAYGVGYGAHLGMIALAHFADRVRSGSLAAALAKATALGYLVLALPYLAVWRENTHVTGLAAGALAIIIAALVGFARWQPDVRACPADTARWMRQGLVGAIASALAFGLISLIEPWSTSIR